MAKDKDKSIRLTNLNPEGLTDTVVKNIGDDILKLTERNTTKYIGEIPLEKQPYNFNVLSFLPDIDATHSAAIRMKVGLSTMMGYEIVNAQSMPSEFFDLLEQPNYNFNSTFEGLISNLMMNWFTYGNMDMHCNKTTRRRNLYALDSKDIFVKAKRRNGIKELGNAESYHRIDQDSNQVLETYLPYEGDMLIGRKYCYRFKNYSHRSQYYGSPSYLSAISAIEENAYITKYNIYYFKNNARPNLIITATGSDITEKQQEELKNDLQSQFKGIENQHKVFLLSTPEERARFTVERISQQVDGSFIQLRADNRNLIAMIHNVPTKLLDLSNTSSFGGGSADIGALKVFIETEIKPSIMLLERFLNRFFKAEFNADPKIRFNTADITNPKDDAVVYNMLHGIVNQKGERAITVKEIRDRYKMPETETMETGFDNNSDIKVTNEGDVRSNSNLATERSISDTEINLDKE